MKDIINFKYLYKNMIRGAIASLIIFLSISCDSSNTIKPDSFIGWNTICSSQFSLYPIIDSNIVILTGYCEGGVACIQGVDMETGELKWEYKDNGLKSIFYNSSLYSTDRLLCIPFNKRTVCIDKKSGIKRWEEFHENELSMEAHLSGFKNKIFRSSKSVESHSVWQYCLRTGGCTVINKFPLKVGMNSILRTPVVIDEKGSTSLVVSNDTYNQKTKISKGFVLRIKSDKSIDTLLKDLQFEKANFSPIHYHNDQVLLLVNLTTLLMYSINKKVIVWRLRMPHSILTSRIEINNDTIYYPCEDEYLYAINAKEGNILWKSQGYGTPSRLAMNNNYIFMTGGNNGILNQYNRTSGKLIAKYKFRDYFRIIQRTISIKNNVLIFSDGFFWYARDVDKLEQDLLLVKVN